MTTNDFPRILTLLRKERDISQKQVAQDLGISQALLSHYEKGIRECGLNFVLKAADYYGVSCDFLLGRTPHRSGAVLSIKENTDRSSKSKSASASNAEYNRRITVNTLNLVYKILEKIGSDDLTEEMSVYLSSALYSAFRILHSANSKNPKSSFTISPKLYEAHASANMMMALSQCKFILSGEKLSSGEQLKRDAFPVLTNEAISKDYPNLSPSLYDLISGVEDSMKALRADEGSKKS